MMNNKPRNPKVVPDGIDLRDWFAGLAMQGYCSDLTAAESKGYDVCVKEIAREAYCMADAMLAERERNHD